MDSPLINHCAKNPRPYTYFGIGSAPHHTVDALTPAWNQVVPLFVTEVKKEVRIIHYDPYFRLPWLTEYFEKTYPNLVFSKFEDGWLWQSDTLEIIVFPKQFHRDEESWIVESLINQCLLGDFQFVLQEYTGTEIRSWFQKLYDATKRKEYFKAKILFDVSYGADTGCMTNLTKYKPYYNSRGDFINLMLFTEAEMKKTIGIHPDIDAHILKHYKKKCSRRIDFHFVNYRRRVKGDTLMNTCEWYGESATPDEIMSVLQNEINQTLPVLTQLGYLTPEKKAALHELFKEYYMVDMYEWSTLVKKVIA